MKRTACSGQREYTWRQPTVSAQTNEDIASMQRAFSAALILALLVACTARVDGPSVRVKPPSIEVDSGGGGDFCPPGQAKKGRC